MRRIFKQKKAFFNWAPKEFPENKNDELEFKRVCGECSRYAYNVESVLLLYNYPVEIYFGSIMLKVAVLLVT